MINENSNVDRLFRDGLRDYEESFPSYVWDNVKDQLDNKKKQRTIFYLRSVAASVVVVVAFGAGYFLTQNPAKKSNPVALSIPIKVDINVKKSVAVENTVVKNAVQTPTKKVRKSFAVKPTPKEEIKEQPQPLMMSFMAQPEYATSDSVVKRSTKVKIENELINTELQLLQTPSSPSLAQLLAEHKTFVSPIEKATTEKKANLFTRLKKLFKK